MNDEETDYQKERAARMREIERHGIAKVIFRDLCAEDNHRHPNRDTPTDYAAMALEAVEAADALLVALEFDPEKRVLPDYEA